MASSLLNAALIVAVARNLVWKLFQSFKSKSSSGTRFTDDTFLSPKITVAIEITALRMRRLKVYN